MVGTTTLILVRVRRETYVRVTEDSVGECVLIETWINLLLSLTIVETGV